MLLHVLALTPLMLVQDLLHALNFDSIPVTVAQPIIPDRAPRRERRNVPGAGR